MTTRESPTKPAAPEGWAAIVQPVALVALAWSLFQIAIYVFPTMDIMIRRGGHVAFGIALAFLTLKGSSPPGWVRWALAALVMAVPVYLWTQLDRLYDRIADLDPVLTGDYIAAGVLLALLVEATRRRMGLGMALLILGFIAYMLFGAHLPGLLAHQVDSFETFIDVMFLTERGIFGIPTGVSAEVVFYFVLFAAVFDVYGGGRLIIDLAVCATGRRVGGPAKAAVLASGLTGSVSGSAVANVMSTGIFTIPLMRRVGYDPRFAASVEAVASTGGQIMPPVMGAGAFIMADFLQMPYGQIALAAVLPSLLYFASLVWAVHLEARNSDLPVLPESEIGRFGPILRERWHLLIPLAWLAALIVQGYAVVDAAIQSILLTIVVGSLRATTRQGPLALVEALVATAKRSVSVALPCAGASVIVAVISFTGLGTKFTALMLAASGGFAWAAVLMGALGALVLGAGMPTTSAYIMGAVLVVPALAQFAIEPLVAHMFIFYFAIMSMVTPPVALAAYAAATIADTDPTRTGYRSVLLAIPCLIVPFGFVLHPALLTLPGVAEVAWALLVLAVVEWAVSIALIGWFGRHLSILHRLAIGLAGAAALWPDPLVFVGSVIALAVLLLPLVGGLSLPGRPGRARTSD